MNRDAAKLYCPNYHCQTPNPQSNRFCQHCRTPLPKRYLWLVGRDVESFPIEKVLADRYVVKQPRIVLDTHPGVLPESPNEISEAVESYLRLSPHQLHVPQVYGLVQLPQQRADVLLLEQAAIYPEGTVSASGEMLEGSLLPELSAVWRQSSALRQLNWLCQLAQLWHPLSAQKATSTLLQPKLLRVEGALVRLRELQFDGRKASSLEDLGQLWQQWQTNSQPEIADFLDQLCQQMQRGQVQNSEQLTTLLNRGIAVCSQAQTRQVEMATRTDQGPSRQRNEDACYPPSGTVWSISASGSVGALIDVERDRAADSEVMPLVVVCDGIGGHEGGSIASNLAIATVQQRLQSLPLQNSALDPAGLTSQLEQVSLAANDVISQRNDTEQRQERQRMGTTLVMALVRHHELYLTHVGDSRAYRITRTGCHQVTLDDDLAARETRLGYALYRDALQQPGSGSLVQALGMNASSLLHPTVQRFVLDEDCLFLLCSDGLSDNDRVEQYWQTELLPILQGELDVATASQRLVTLANSTNGHDNVTVGLIYCQVLTSKPLEVPLDRSLAVLSPVVGQSQSRLETSLGSTATAKVTSKTHILSPQRSAPNLLSTLLGVFLLLVLGGLVGYLFVPEIRTWGDSLWGGTPTPPPEPVAATPSSPDPAPDSSPAPSPNLSVGSFVQINRSAIDGVTRSTPTILRQQPPGTTPTQSPDLLGSVPVGSVLQITSRQAIADQGYWLRLRVCSLPVGANLAAPGIAQPGASGWIEQTAIAPLVTQSLSLRSTELGKCAPLPPSPAVSPASNQPPSSNP